MLKSTGDDRGQTEMKLRSLGWQASRTNLLKAGVFWCVGQGAHPMTADTAMDHQPMPGANMNGSAPSHSTCTDT